jgi:signal transduction histidine kinase/DNA-binding response OmpR family regulator
MGLKLQDKELLQSEIIKKSKIETFGVILFGTVFFFGTLSLIIYQFYIMIPNKLLTLSIPDILHSLQNGDEFFIRNKFSYLMKTNNFCAIWIEDNTNYIIQHDNTVCSPLIKNYVRNLDVHILKYRFYIIQKKIISQNNLPRIYTAKEINIYLIIMMYILFISMIIFISMKLLKKRLKSYQHFVDQVKSAELSGITSSVRMLAHDIRAPFSMLNIIISSFEKSISLEDLSQKSSRAKADLSVYMNKVTMMLNDFMHFGDKNKEQLESFDPKEVIYYILINFAKINEKCNLNFSYDFGHRNHLFFTKIQFERIITNIISNAIEAMLGVGKLWFQTKNIKIKDRIFIQFCIGNSNSFISENNRKRIFDLNFTMGKETGTGIGLYSVKTLVESSGGTISCQSEKGKGVEFFFTLPASSDKINISKKITPPENAALIMKQRNGNQAEISIELWDDKIKVINQTILLNKNKISVLFIDDEEVYLGAMYDMTRELFSESEKMICFYKATNYDDAIRIYHEEKPNIIISDIDLKDQIHDGFEIIKYVHKRDKNCYLCVHTNRLFSKERVFEMGAHHFILKPIDKIGLFEIFNHFLLQKFFQFKENLSSKETVIVVDDCKIYLEMWKMSLDDANVIAFENPESLFEGVLKDNELLKRTSCIILDYYYDGIPKNIVQMKSVDLLRKHGYENPCFLSSDMCCSQQELQDFDGFIEKQPKTFSEIKKLFPEKFIKV